MAKKNRRRRVDKEPMIFGSLNYKLLTLGLLLITGGFTAMYIENKVNGFISLYISPIVIVAGYVAVIFSILANRSAETVGRGNRAES